MKNEIILQKGKLYIDGQELSESSAIFQYSHSDDHSDYFRTIRNGWKYYRHSGLIGFLKGDEYVQLTEKQIEELKTKGQLISE